MRLDGVVNQVRHNASVAVAASKYPPAFGIDSCAYTIDAVQGTRVITIEGLAKGGQQAAGLDRSPGAPVRVLPAGIHHGRRRAAGQESQAEASEGGSEGMALPDP